MRRFVTTIALACVAAWIPGSLCAQVVTEVCYSPEQASGAATPPTSSTQFSCPISGTFTINQLAAQGFRIVSLSPVSGLAPLSVRQQLLVKRVARIHGSGFEA